MSLPPAPSLARNRQVLLFSLLRMFPFQSEIGDYHFLYLSAPWVQWPEIPVNPYGGKSGGYMTFLFSRNSELERISLFLVFGNLVLTPEKAMAPHSSTLAWKIPWTEEPGRLQSMRSLRVGHDWTTSLSLFTFMHWRRKWQPTPGRDSLVGCRLWGRTESDMIETTQQQQQQQQQSLQSPYFYPQLVGDNTHYRPPVTNSVGHQGTQCSAYFI